MLALLSQQAGEAIHTLGRRRMPGAENLASQGERLAIQRLSIGKLAVILRSLGANKQPRAGTSSGCRRPYTGSGFKNQSLRGFD